MLTDDDNFIGFDFDYCISDDGQLSDDIQSLIDKIDSYGEISPSGKGIRIIAEGSIADGIKNRRNDIEGAKGIEVYDKGRYLTITGKALYGEAKPIKKLPADFWSFYSKLGHGTVLDTGGNQIEPGFNGKDQWVIDKLLEDEKYGSEFRRLYMYGDMSSLEGDQSRADLKLVGLISYYAGFDINQIDRIFRSSKLFREKWDRSHRIDGATYGQMTIEKALDDRYIRHKNETESFLKYHFDFRYNEVLGRVEFQKRGEKEWGLVDRRSFSSILRKIKNSNGKCGEQYLHVILDSDFCPSFNPFEDYFNSLPAVTGTGELQKLLDTVQTTDKDYWEWSFQRWLVALVACALDEEVSNHSVCVFQGKQGVGKSTWLSNLLPRKLKDYTYPGELDPSNKDTMVYLSECLLINLDELASLNRGKESALKEVITKNKIKVRKVYRRNPESLIRRASFTGSVNDSQILTDTTGSRRFLIHEVINIDYSTRIDIDKVMAEAFGLYKSGFKYWFDGVDINRIDTQNNRFRQVSALEEILLRNFEPVNPNTPKCSIERWTATELMNHMMEGKLLPKAASVSYLGKLLQKHGFTFQNHSGVYVYQIQRKQNYSRKAQILNIKNNNNK